MKTGCCNTENLLRMEAHTICINPGCENYLGITSASKKYSRIKTTITLSALTFCLLFSFDDFSMGERKELTTTIDTAPENIIPADFESVQKELELLQVICPEVVLAQVKIESGNFTSSLYKRTNNMIGMRYPFKRPTVAAGIFIPSMDTVIYGDREALRKYSRTMNYAVYNNWRDCLQDYKLWQESNFNVDKQYLAFLGKVYATDTSYIAKLKKVAKASN